MGPAAAPPYGADLKGNIQHQMRWCKSKTKANLLTTLGPHELQAPFPLLLQHKPRKIRRILLTGCLRRHGCTTPPALRMHSKIRPASSPPTETLPPIHRHARPIGLAPRNFRRPDIQARVPMSHLAVTEETRVSQKGNREGHSASLSHTWGDCWPKGTRFWTRRCPSSSMVTSR